MIPAPRLLRPFLLLALALSAPGRAQQPAPGAASPPVSMPATNSAPAPTAPAQEQSGEIAGILNDVVHLLAQNQSDAALEKVNLAIRLAPQDRDSYGLRAGIYAKKEMWPQAEQDYRKVLQIDPANAPAKFDLAEIKFRQKLYDQARPDFVALEKDDSLGDLAGFKVFLCDLAAGHVDVAARELDAFNQVGENASYYFANAAWSLSHHKTEEGRGWLASAVQIFAENKFNTYSVGLQELGYLPLPPPPAP